MSVDTVVAVVLWDQDGIYPIKRTADTITNPIDPFECNRQTARIINLKFYKGFLQIGYVRQNLMCFTKSCISCRVVLRWWWAAAKFEHGKINAHKTNDKVPAQEELKGEKV